MRKSVSLCFAVVLLVVGAHAAGAQSRQIEGPLAATVGETVTFRVTGGGFTSWFVTPSSSLQILGPNNGASVTVRVVSVPRDGRGRISSGTETFHFDILEAGTVPLAAIPPPATPAPPAASAPTLTPAEALEFVRNMASGEIAGVLGTIEAVPLIAGLPLPAWAANAEVLLDALLDTHGEVAILIAFMQMNEVGAAVLFTENQALAQRVIDLLRP